MYLFSSLFSLTRMSNERIFFLLLTVFTISISQTITVTVDITTIAKNEDQDVTTEYTKQTPWPNFIPCQYAENSSYFCPKERPRFGSCSSPPADNDYYCTEDGYCQCDYYNNLLLYIFIGVPVIIIIIIIIGVVTCCYCCICKKPRTDGNATRATTKTYKDVNFETI